MGILRLPTEGRTSASAFAVPRCSPRGCSQVLDRQWPAGDRAGLWSRAQPLALHLPAWAALCPVPRCLALGVFVLGHDPWQHGGQSRGVILKTSGPCQSTAPLRPDAGCLAPWLLCWGDWTCSLQSLLLLSRCGRRSHRRVFPAVPGTGAPREALASDWKTRRSRASGPLHALLTLLACPGDLSQRPRPATRPLQHTPWHGAHCGWRQRPYVKDWAWTGLGRCSRAPAPALRPRPCPGGAGGSALEPGLASHPGHPGASLLPPCI